MGNASSCRSCRPTRSRQPLPPHTPWRDWEAYRSLPATGKLERNHNPRPYAWKAEGAILEKIKRARAALICQTPALSTIGPQMGFSAIVSKRPYGDRGALILIDHAIASLGGGMVSDGTSNGANNAKSLFRDASNRCHRWPLALPRF
jgi:hypothetical protein